MATYIGIGDDWYMSYLKARMDEMIAKVGQAGEFNCYSMARYITGLADTLKFEGHHAIEDDVENKTDMISRENAKQGDLLVFAYGGYIVHAAVLVDPVTGMYIQKAGHGNIEFNDFESTMVSPKYGQVSEIRRVK
jgi:hypothetical protein